MATLAPSKANNRHYRCLCKKRKMKNQLPVIHGAQKPSTVSTLLTLFCLISIFAVLAYFHPH